MIYIYIIELNSLLILVYIKSTFLRIRMEINSLRNVKTEALFVYLNTIVQDYLEKLEIKEFDICIKDEKQEKEIIDSIKFLKTHLSKFTLNAYELASLIKIKYTKQKSIPHYYRALTYYYNVIIIEMEKQFQPEDKWIPEQIIFALLSEWIFEEEKLNTKFDILKEIDYFKLLSYIEYAAKEETDEEFKKSVKEMYLISTSVIKSLKNAKFKINTTRKSNVL